MTEILVKVCGRYQNLSVRLVMEAGFTGSKSSALWISGFRGIGSVQAACTKTRSGTLAVLSPPVPLIGSLLPRDKISFSITYEK